MQFFNLNIRHEGYQREYGSAAVYWLDRCKQAPIFFGDLTVNDVREKSNAFCGKEDCWKKEQQSQILDFCNSSSPVCVSIDEGWVWIYELTGKVRMCAERSPPIKGKDSEWSDIPKIRDIKLLKNKRISEVPLVLASMKANRWMSSGTFREIKQTTDTTNMGNLAAIQSVTNRWIDDFLVDPLDCISSLEFETLIAKIFEEHGCFVPAYKGGFLRDVDLIVEPTTDIYLADKKFSKTEGRLSLQLKMQVYPELLNGGTIQYAIGLNSDASIQDFRRRELNNANACLGRTWVRNALRQSPDSLAWLERLLKWLPPEKRRPAFAI